jgi:hypothetical protein
MSIESDMRAFAKERDRQTRVLRRNASRWAQGSLSAAATVLDRKDDVTLGFAAFSLIRACALGSEAEATLRAIRGHGPRSPIEMLAEVGRSEFDLQSLWADEAHRVAALASQWLGDVHDGAVAHGFDGVLDALCEHHELIAVREYARQERLSGFEVPDRPAVVVPDEPDFVADVAFHVSHYLRRQWLVQPIRRHLYSDDPYGGIAKFAQTPRPSMLTIDPLLRDLPLSPEENTNLAEMLFQIDEALRNLQYREFFDQLRHGVHENSALIGSRHPINLIPSDSQGSCCPVLLAFASGDRAVSRRSPRRGSSAAETCQAIREHLIHCHSITKVVVLITDTWVERSFADSLPDFRAHAARGVRFLPLIAHPGGLSPVSLPL